MGPWAFLFKPHGPLRVFPKGLSAHASRAPWAHGPFCSNRMGHRGYTPWASLFMPRGTMCVLQKGLLLYAAKPAKGSPEAISNKKNPCDVATNKRRKL